MGQAFAAVNQFFDRYVDHGWDVRLGSVLI